MLVAAAARGVTHLDTARGYGIAESRIGDILAAEATTTLRVVTKLAPLPKLGGKASAEQIALAVDASVFRSCHALRRQRIDVLMFHRQNDMFQWNGAALDHLAGLMQEGVIGALGVSVYTPEEAIASLADPRIEHVQIPFNLLDGRWLDEPFQSALRARPTATIHVRSVFLQGLLINAPAVWPSWFRRSETFVKKIRRLCSEFGRQSPADLCMAYVAAHPWVTIMVLGVERLVQLEELLDVASRPPLSAQEVTLVRAAFPNVPKRLMNPAKW
jgi:spore coat polysaccharide biosynthesis protein SpsF